MDPLTIWIMVMATLWLVRILFEELWAGLHGRESPRIARRRAREQMARESGVPTVGQVLSVRLAHRIAHPPERRLLGKVRALLVECAEDALDEARVRHQRNRQQRARRRGRAAGWQARTGGAARTSSGQPPPSGQAPPAQPPPPPREDDEDDVLDTWPCRLCGAGLVVDPDELCDECERNQHPDPGPEPTPDPVTDQNDTDQNDTDQNHDLKGHPMASATHEINVDVRDPRTALAFASSCQAFSNAVVGQLEILASNLERTGVGPRPIGAVRVLADEARSYSASTGRSIEAYAAHVVAQAEIAGDEDLRETVADTYLDTRGGDAGAVPPSLAGGSSTTTINAADCDTPAAGEHFMSEVGRAFAALVTSVDHVRGTHTRQGITGEPIRFLDEQLEATTRIAEEAADAAGAFRAHSARRNDTVGADPSLHGTQEGRYLDPARA